MGAKILLLCLLTGAAVTLRAADTVTLNDGRTVKGTIVKEDADSVFVRQEDGDERGIAKTRIARIERVVNVGVAGEKTAPETPTPAASAVVKEFAARIADLGSPVRAARQAALIKLRAKSREAIPVMLGLLNPKLDTGEFTRIGIIRFLVEQAPLSVQASRTLAYTVLHDPYPETRREACDAIRALKDDAAITELLRAASSPNSADQRALAAALHELDDPRILAALVRAIPPPQVQANVTGACGLEKPKYVLPVGPGGLNLPIYLPKASVAGVAQDIDSPAAQLLKLIAGKDLGSTGYAWSNWYREKVGDITAADRDSYYQNRSLYNRMGVPPGDTNVP